jgi:Protein of unknown function (DUF4238)
MGSQRQHYLAAGVLGKFSTEQRAAPTRDRKVWVLRRNGLLHLQAASSVAFENDLYSTGDLQLWHGTAGIKGSGSRDSVVERHWSGFDGRINAALEEMLAHGPGQYRADPWVHVASYIATLFARSPDFHHLFRARFADPDGLASYLTPAHINMTRTLEYQRVAAAVLRARWAILRSDAYPLIINDRGMTAMFNPRWGTYGYVVQLRPNIAMALGQGPYRKALTWVNDAWRIDLPTEHLDVQGASSLNDVTWQQCRREAYSGSEGELQRVRRIPPPPPGHPDPFEGAQLLGLTGRQRMEDDALILRLLGGIKPPPDPTNPPVLAA